MIITHIRALISLLITTHKPSSKPYTINWPGALCAGGLKGRTGPDGTTPLQFLRLMI